MAQCLLATLVTVAVRGTPRMTHTGGGSQDIEVAGPIQYARISTDGDGETHVSDKTLSFQLVDYAPPAPPISVSEIFEAQNVSFISSPAGWHGDWHPAPRRQFILILEGELEIEVSDGEARRLVPGSLCLVEDTSGKGHVSRVVGSERVLAAAIPLGGE